jgi:hypothetical protein
MAAADSSGGGIERGQAERDGVEWRDGMRRNAKGKKRNSRNYCIRNIFCNFKKRNTLLIRAKLCKPNMLRPSGLPSYHSSFLINPIKILRSIKKEKVYITPSSTRGRLHNPQPMKRSVSPSTFQNRSNYPYRSFEKRSKS